MKQRNVLLKFSLHVSSCETELMCMLQLEQLRLTWLCSGWRQPWHWWNLCAVVEKPPEDHLAHMGNPWLLQPYTGA